jgi:hypothetical protein
MTDHVWFNIPKNLQQGLIEVLTLQLISEQPDSAGGLSRRLSTKLDVWDVDSLVMQGVLSKELNHKVTLKDGKYYLTPNGKEVLPDSVYEITKVLSLCPDSTFADKNGEAKKT